MTKQKIASWRKAAIGAVAGLVSLLPSSQALAQNGQPGAPSDEPASRYQVRTRIENTQDNLATNYLKSTLGISLCDENGKSGQENFRAYNYSGEISGQEINWTSIGLSLPYNAGNLKNKTTLFGSLGDKQGIGIQSEHTLGDLTLTLNTEKSKKARRSINAERLGIGFDYQIGNVIVGTGFDTRDTDTGRLNQGLVSGVWNTTKNDQLGLAYVVSESDTLKNDSISGYWCHYGKDQKWGTRTWAKVDWNNNDRKSLVFDSIIVQNPTFSKFSSPWVVSRKSNDMYDLRVVEDPVLYVEEVPLGNRSKGGLVGELKAVYIDNAGERSGFIRTDGGYKLNLSDNINVTPTVFYSHGIGNNEIDKYGGSVTVNLGKFLGKNWMIEGSVSRDSEGKAEAYSGIKVVWEF